MSAVTAKPIYVLLGCPGSGKGTIAQSIKGQGYIHISTGDITREEVQKQTAFGIKYREAILNHVIGGIPFEEIQRLVEERIEWAISNQQGVVLDGYPKTVEQCNFLDHYVSQKDLKNKIVVILLNIDEQSAIDRISLRQVCEKCNAVYNSKFCPSKNPDVCDHCQSPLNQRLDANTEGTKKRVFEFKSKMESVIQYYGDQNRLNIFDANVSLEKCIENFISFHHTIKAV